nr:hypothetical protein [Pseudomonas sp. CHM02]
MRIVRTLWDLISKDHRPQREIERERAFIQAANSLKTLRVTPEGAMFIDPEEFREQIVSAREQLKRIVHDPRALGGPFQASESHRADEGAGFAVEAPVEPMDCIEVVAWRRLSSGAALRYVCLQSTSTGRSAVATASLFTEAMESLPTWVDGNTNRQVATALQSSEIRWFGSVSEAMKAWDAELR